MEEKGGWITGDVPKQDEEIQDVVIEIMAEASQQGHDQAIINPFKAQNNEILPSNVKRNYCGFLMRKDPITYKVNTHKLKERIVVLKDHLLIAKFVGPKPPMQDVKLWIQALTMEFRGNTLSICRNVGNGFFFFLWADDRDTLLNALMLSPFKSQWGTCMLQSRCHVSTRTTLAILLFLHGLHWGSYHMNTTIKH